MINKNIATVTIDGTETAVEFDKNYTHFWILNLGGSEIYASTESGVTADSDGVLTVMSGAAACTMHGYGADTLYLSGSGKVQIVGTYSAFCPFKLNGGKGGSTGSGLPFEDVQMGYTTAGIVTFEKPFAEAPLVMVTGIGGTSSSTHIGIVGTPTTTGFETDRGGHTAMNWMAFGKLADEEETV